MNKTVLLAASLLLGWVVPSSAQAPPGSASLELTHRTVADAVRSGNLALLNGLIHPAALGFFQDSQMLVQLRPDFGPQEALGSVVKDLARFVATPYTAEHRVVGSTGVVCITSAIRDPKGRTEYLRVTYVYVLADGNWRLLSWHSSAVPLKR